MNKFFSILVAGIFLALAGCVSVATDAQPTTQRATAVDSGKRWIGVMAVVESPLVNQVIAENGNDPARYGPALRQLVDTGRAQAAPGNYCFIPYQGGQPSDRPECFTTTTGIYTMWAPAYMVQPGTAMCVQVPGSWPAIAGQRRFPAAGGKAVNCYDFGSEAGSPAFARDRRTAAMVVVIKPRN